MTRAHTETPLVLVPGIQGRWEWLAPAIRVLDRNHEVLTFSLGEVSGPHLFERWAARIDRLLDTGDRKKAVLIGISFGGLIAAWYAAHHPDRVSALILVAAPSPHWQIDDQSARYARHPRLSLPLFALRAAGRLAPELAAAMPGWRARLLFGAGYAVRAVRYPASPRQMANIVAEWRRTNLTDITGRVTAPTLVITGEESLDRVVPVASTLEYLSLIPGAVHARLPRTGHIGCLSKPAEFAALVSDFLHASRSDRARGRP